MKLEVQDDIFISIHIRKNNYKIKGFYGNKVEIKVTRNAKTAFYKPKINSKTSK